jgi:hypothetical protein
MIILICFPFHHMQACSYPSLPTLFFLSSSLVWFSDQVFGSAFPSFYTSEGAWVDVSTLAEEGEDCISWLCRGGKGVIVIREVLVLGSTSR